MNKAIQDKIAAATSKTHIRTTETITIPVWQRWLKEAGKYKFDKPLMNLSEVLSEKLQYLLHGKPYIIEHTTDKKAGEFAEKLLLQETMFHVEKLLFDHGTAYIAIEKVGNKKKPFIQLRPAEPNFPNVVTRLGNIKVRAEIWSTFQFDKVKYYQQTIYTPDYIYNNVYDGGTDKTPEELTNKDKTSLKDLNKKIGDPNLQIEAKVKNPYGFIPVIQMFYKPTMDFSWQGSKAIAPKQRVDRQQAFLNDGTKALSLELYLNRTKILVDQDMINSGDRAMLSKIADENILGLLKDTGNVDGESKAIEVIQGDPKVDQYWANIKNIISIAISSLKLSELSEEQGAASATGEIFNKGNDVETANTLQIFRQKAITEIMTKAIAMRDGVKFTEYEIDSKDLNIQLIPNVIMNEAKLTDIVVKQLGANLISMTQAKVKLEGISSEDAKTALAEAEKEEFYNPTVDAMSGFGDNGENGDKEKSEPLIKDNNGKDVVNGN